MCWGTEILIRTKHKISPTMQVVRLHCLLKCYKGWISCTKSSQSSLKHITSLLYTNSVFTHYFCITLYEKFKSLLYDFFNYFVVSLLAIVLFYIVTTLCKLSSSSQPHSWVPLRVRVHIVCERCQMSASIKYLISLFPHLPFRIFQLQQCRDMLSVVITQLI